VSNCTIHITRLGVIEAKGKLANNWREMELRVDCSLVMLVSVWIFVVSREMQGMNLWPPKKTPIGTLEKAKGEEIVPYRFRPPSRPPRMEVVALRGRKRSARKPQPKKVHPT